METIDLLVGNFNISSSKTVISDPCYSRTLDSGITYLDKVKNGLWHGVVKILDKKQTQGWGERNTELLVVHHDSLFIKSPKWSKHKTKIGVDSGQVGIFCNSLYPHTEIDSEDCNSETSFYGQCCKATLKTKHSCDIVGNKGIVSSSGFGDGEYKLFVSKNNNEEIIAIKIVFIDSKDLQEERI